MKSLATIAALILSAPALLAQPNLVTTGSASRSVLRAGFSYAGIIFEVANIGLDAATEVKLNVSSSVPVCCNVDLGNLRPGERRSFFFEVQVPDTAGTFTVTATATSATTEFDPGDNSASLAFTISTDPDLVLSLGGPTATDLGLPFTLTILLANPSKTTAHDVEATVDGPPDVVIRSLPAGCSSPAAGRIVCRVAELAPTPAATPLFEASVVAPTARDGSIVFTGNVTAREGDADPDSNRATLTVALNDTIYVTTTANDGSGSLRQAIDEVNANCRGKACTIAFRIEEPSPTPWTTIRVTSPLPPVIAPRIRIDGSTQSGSNTKGPQIEISGGGSVDGDGLLIASCGAEVAHLVLNGFRGNGISVVEPALQQACPAYVPTTLHHLFVGIDPTGAEARPNLRGIGTLVDNGTTYYTARSPTNIRDCVISGNLRSGIFGYSGRLSLSSNRIGVKARADEPLPNGNAGVYIGAGGYGSSVSGGVIAFNGHMGIAVAAGVADVSIYDNRIWDNGGLGIDIGLDGPTQSAGGAVAVPALTLAHYDPVSKKTIVEGDFNRPLQTTFAPFVNFYANDAPDPSGHGEGQRPIGVVRVFTGISDHFTFAVDGDLTGQFITATATRILYIGFGKPAPADIGSGFLTQTSEFSRPIEVR